MASIESVFGIIGVGFLLLSIPAIQERGVNDFGLAGITGTTQTGDFPPWENQSDVFTNVNETVDGVLKIDDGSKTGFFESVELTNEPDEFQLIKVRYETFIPEPDSEINLTLKAYDEESMTDADTQSVVLQNGTSTYRFDERIHGRYLKTQVDFSRVSSSDPSPELESTQIYVDSIDASPLAGVYQNVIMMAIIGFSLVLIVLILGD